MRTFRVTNTSSGPGCVRVTIPLGPGTILLPGTPPGRRRQQAKRGHLTHVINEDQLRRLVGFYRRGQMSVVALDGQPLPAWLGAHESPPERVVTEVLVAPVAVSAREVELEAVAAAPVVEEPVAVVFVPEARVHYVYSSTEEVSSEESVQEVTPEPVVSAGRGLDKLTVAEVRALASELTEVAQLQELLDEENSGRARKTAIKAIEDRIQELGNGAE